MEIKNCTVDDYSCMDTKKLNRITFLVSTNHEEAKLNIEYFKEKALVIDFNQITTQDNKFHWN